VRILCRLLNVSKSGYYQFVAANQSQRKCDNEKLVAQIKIIQKESYHSYGYRRMHAKLKQGGLKCGRNKVQKLMKAYQLSAKRKKKFIVTTNSQHNRTIAPNILKRQFKANSPNTHWVSDLTYIRTKTGWAYLAIIIDLYSRAVVGWSIDKQMPTFLVIEALNTALGKRNPERCFSAKLSHIIFNLRCHHT
jgi:putative transposase